MDDFIYYEQKAKEILDKNDFENSFFDDIDAYLLPPYLEYMKLIKANCKKQDKVLELGAGTGNLTKLLVDSNLKITASDISPSSLEVLKKRYSKYNKLKTKILDMSREVNTNEKFKIIVSAGSMSYADNKQLLDNIYNLLEEKGKFICVDSYSAFNIYQLNRLLQVILGKRSWSTFKRMPNQKLVSLYKKEDSEVVK